MDATKLNNQLVEFPISIGLYAEFRNRVWLGLLITELNERIKIELGQPAKFANVESDNPVYAYISELKSMAAARDLKAVLVGEYVFGSMDASKGVIMPERVKDFMEVFSDRVYNQVKMSTPEGESPSLLYYSWFEFVIYEMLHSVIDEDNTRITVENVAANIKAVAFSGKRLCYAAIHNINFRNHLISIMGSNDILNESSFNRGLIVYDNILNALKTRCKPEMVQRSAYEMQTSFYSSDQIPMNSTYDRSTTIIGSSKLIRKIDEVHNAIDFKELQEIKSLVDGFKGLIQDSV